jgi:hypothetical protein
MNQPRLFTKWRRSLAASAPKPAAAVVPTVLTPAGEPALAGAATGL